jgi:arylsulfatase A-like enzyme
MTVSRGVVAPVAIDGPSAKRAAHGLPNGIRLSSSTAVLLAIAFGLCAGYFDLLLILIRKLFWREDLTLRVARDFRWTVPVSHAFLLLIVGIVVATIIRLRPKLISIRAASWLFATLAIWWALLRLPMYGVCTFLLAAGLGRPISTAIATRVSHPRTVRYVLGGLCGLLLVLAALSTGRLFIQERVSVARSPAAPSARNVLLIVWDTVRAYNLSTYGYGRNTSPNLTQIARQGVLYNRAISAAPWTYPSHSCFFTGHWPLELNSQWKFTLDTPDPTLAEYLASRGYQTAGFAANTFCCNYETGLARGFNHFEDFTLTPRSILGRTVPGQWVLMHLLFRGMYHDLKWIGLQSQGAWRTSDALLDWLGQRRTDRPFFAFVNWYDAHDPYIPPPGFEGRFGIRPKWPRDHNFLFDYMAMDKDHMIKRDIQLAVDSYDSCIAFLDASLGRLMGELRSRGLLDNTLVVITADHGEAFGDHFKYGHTNGLYLEEIGVPLIILSPSAPAGRAVDEPVSLRDLPATILDQLGMSAGSPFPGHSLAQYWQPTTENSRPPTVSPSLSEMATGFAFGLQPSRGEGNHGFQYSLVASGHHYLRDGAGNEALYNLNKDPYEAANVLGSSLGDRTVAFFRKALFDVLTANPGSSEVENSYLRAFRQQLSSPLVENPRATTAAGN